MLLLKSDIVCKIESLPYEGPNIIILSISLLTSSSISMYRISSYKGDFISISKELNKTYQNLHHPILKQVTIIQKITKNQEPRTNNQVIMPTVTPNRFISLFLTAPQNLIGTNFFCREEKVSGRSVVVWGM